LLFRCAVHSDVLTFSVLCTCTCVHGGAPHLIDVRCGQTAHDAILALHLITESIHCRRAHHSFGHITTAQRSMPLNSACEHTLSFSPTTDQHIRPPTACASRTFD
jgi:hypothetical protein